MKTLTIQVPDAVFGWLSEKARQRQETEAEVASQALAAAVQPPAPSLGALMADLAGVGQGIRSDLSTNPEHLADFGR